MVTSHVNIFVRPTTFYNPLKFQEQQQQHQQLQHHPFNRTPLLSLLAIFYYFVLHFVYGLFASYLCCTSLHITSFILNCKSFYNCFFNRFFCVFFSNFPNNSNSRRGNWHVFYFRWRLLLWLLIFWVYNYIAKYGPCQVLYLQAAVNFNFCQSHISNK